MLCLYSSPKSQIARMALLTRFCNLKEKIGVLLASGKPCLGPSVTVSCWSAVQDGPHTRALGQTYSLPLLLQLGKSSCPMWCFNCSAKSGLCEPYTELSLIFSLCHCATSCARGQHLLSQHIEVKLGYNQPEFKPMGHIWEQRYVKSLTWSGKVEYTNSPI